KKVFSRVPALAMAAALAAAAVVPLASRAGNDSHSEDTEPGRGNSVSSSWVKAVDGNGDANAIGKFNRNEANKNLAKANGTVKADGTDCLFTDLANDQKVNLRGSFSTVGKFVWAKKITIKS